MCRSKRYARRGSVVFSGNGSDDKENSRKSVSFRTKKQQALGIRGQEKSPQSHQFWISDSILRLNSVSARSKNDFSPHRFAPSSLCIAIHQIIGEGDLVATRETHEGIHWGDFPTPVGTFDVTGRPIEWTSQVFFRFNTGKIAEMWVARDELGILRSLGITLEARQ